MRLDNPTTEWVEAFIRSHPDCSVVQIAEAWYPLEVTCDRTRWIRARGMIGRRIQVLRHWGIIIRSDHHDHRRGEPALYRCAEVTS